VIICWINLLELFTLVKRPIKLVVREVPSLKQNLFHHKLHLVIIWLLIIPELVRVLEQRVQKLCLFVTKILCIGLYLKYSNLIKLLTDRSLRIDPWLF